jgi:hypothetical protein
MSPLAAAVYEILRRRGRLADPRITYAELARRLRETAGAFESITHRSRELYSALWEVGGACRRLGLPPLPALVVRADSGRPGEAYFEDMAGAFPDDQVAAWQRDLEAVRRADYPPHA